MLTSPIFSISSSSPCIRLLVACRLTAARCRLKALLRRASRVETSTSSTTARDDELQARIREYEASEGYKLKEEIRAFRIGYDIFIGNYADLERILIQAQDPQVWPHLWDEKHRYRLVKFNREVTRLLHNFVAAAKSLVEHTRNHMRAKYAATDFKKEYQARIDQHFTRDPLVQFVEDLRNYMLHKSLAAASLILISDQGKLATHSYVALVPEKLSEWDGWTEGARPYLDTLGDQNSLKELVGAY